MSNDSVLLLVGAARSGTTLLREMLNAHPALNCFGELEYATLGVEGSQFPSVRKYRALLQQDRIYRLNPFPICHANDAREIARGFLESARSLAPNKPWVGATVHHRFDLLPEIWPDAKYVHLVRDPRDVARSTLRLGWQGHPYFGTDIWMDAREQWGRFAQRVDPSQVVTVRYEDLVREPERELRRCVDLLGLAWDPAVLRFHEQSTYRSPDITLIDQWKRKLSPRTVGLIEGRVGQALTEAGYAPSGYPVVRPGYFERAALRVVNRWGRMRFRQRQMGMMLWARTVLANRGVGPLDWRRDTQLEFHRVLNTQI